MMKLQKGPLKLVLSEPGTYYKGVRFDRSGVFRSIEKDGYSYADEWFRVYDPYMHDAVCGCSEEFVCADYEAVAPGRTICKIGVGMLVRPDGEPYSIRRNYALADEGKWECQTGSLSDRAFFKHVLDGQYEYEKCVAITSEDTFEIRHRLLWTGRTPWNGWCYNHNFFTFGGFGDKGTHGYFGTVVGTQRKLDFPFRPEGTWRSEDACVSLVGNGIRFNGPVTPPSVFMGNLHDAGKGLGEGTAYRMSVAEGDRKVRIEGCLGDSPALVDKIIFWSNPDVACLEPYLPINLSCGQTLEWTLRYTLI